VHRPDLLDNLSADTRHGAALAWLDADCPPEWPLAVATGYVNLDGLHHLATTTQPERPVRLMLGALPEPGLGAPLPSLSFEAQMSMLGGERDFSRFPPSRAARRLEAVHGWLASAEVDVRRYVTRFLHGKAYLYGEVTNPRAALVSSANLTGAGLERNLELGLVDYNPGPSGRALAWFDGLWEQAAPFTDELMDLLFPAVGLVDPDTVYLRALLELYGEELEQPVERATSTVALAAFQRDGYERARGIVARHRGVVYADGVGTGKTEVGLAFIEEHVLRRGQLALVVCPAQLKANWTKRLALARLPAQVISFNELAADEQLVPDAPQRRLTLAADKDAYRLVVVDEAHALRNEGTTWYRAMERLLGGEPKDAVFLSATPINNGLWDLYNLVLLFARHDRAFDAIGIPSARKLFERAGANERDPENLDPSVLFPLADAVSVRRDREFIQQRYPDEVFPDGTPVRFPTPRLTTLRYDLDDAHPGLFHAIVTDIGALTMARYRPGAWLQVPDETAAEAQLGGLLQSALLKRFESCWAACAATVGRMLVAHDAFLAAWDDGRGSVPSKAALREAALGDASHAGIAAWVAVALQEDDETRPASDFLADYGAAVATDRALLAAIADRLSRLEAADDPKLALLAATLESSPDQKIAVFATYGETVRYLDEHLPVLVGGRERITVIGSETDPDRRTAALARFCPKTVVRADYVPPDGELDLLLSTDVISEGQNLQQAQAVISYDMPWNPQRVVQRNGRVIRLKSPHEEVHLTTLLPVPGELEELLRLEATVRAKIRAAGVFGMETDVIEGVASELQSYAERLASGDASLLDEVENDEVSSAFLGEQLRALLLRAAQEGELRRIEELPWGVGAAFVPPPGIPVTPGVFFATRTRRMAGAERGHRYWRFAPFDDARDVVRSDVEMLRRINPAGGRDAAVDVAALERTWTRVCADILEEHNARTDPRAARESIGSAQRFALDVLRDPTVILPEGADLAAEALSVERSLAVRRALNDIRADLTAERIARNVAAERIVGVVQSAGLRAVQLDELPEEIDAEDLGVVCWMAVLES
jgi:superfamily II DNA or RNA helicase